MAYLGQFLIFGATGSIIASAVTYLLAWRGHDNMANLGRQFFRVTTAFILAAMALLMVAILKHDFSLAYVFQYSSTDLPLYFLISTLWGGQEGTFLLWIAMAAVMGLVMMATSRDFERGNMFWLSLFILSILVILIKRSPFEVMPVFRAEGNGLNPLLQNYWMTIHPPVMFVGFAASVIPFCFAMTGLVERRYHAWAEAARNWTVFAWSALGIALVMGGYWAYETLGWGGFWAWDPVENASLIPWIFLTAQIHTLYVKRQRRGLMRFSMAMVFLSFWSVLYGTFLTRSGVLADFSVHSFVDLGINQFLIAGLVGFVLIGTFMLVMRWRDIESPPSFSKVNSRTYLLALGIVIMFVGGLLVLLGTSAPLLTRVTENPSSVDIGYYFSTMTPIGVAILFMIAVFPAFRWNDGLNKPFLLIVGLSVAIVTAVTLAIAGVTRDLIYLLLFGGGVAALATNGYALYRSWRGGNFKAGYLSHVGLALALIGAASSAGLESKTQINLPQNQEVQALGYNLTFTGSNEYPQGDGFDCHVNVEKDGSQFVGVLPHEFPKNAEGVMKKPFIRSHLLYDLYLSPIAIEQPEGAAPGSLALEKGGMAELDKYSIRFLDFEMGNHGDESEESISAAAHLEVTYDGKTEEVKPTLVVKGEQVVPMGAGFDDARAEVFISGVDPQSGGVMLQVIGDFLPATSTQATILIMELSTKPLISLFWLGTVLTFLSGILSMLKKQKRELAMDLKRTSAGTPESIEPNNPLAGKQAR